MFRPAGFYSDSDEDSEFGYDFGYSKPEVKSTPLATEPVESHDDVLYKAVSEGNLTEVRRVLELDRYLLTGCLRQGWPVLLLACNEAQYEIVKFLVEEKRVDVNQPFGLKTALMSACGSKRNSETVLKVVDLLLDHGAIINCKDSMGTTPLMLAIWNGHTDVVKLIIDQASLEATDNEGLTALFHAVNHKRFEIVQMLLKAGAVTDYVNKRGFTPRQEAEFKGYLEIAELFPNDKNFYSIPVKYLHYGRYQDICQGEKEDEMPGYHQEIGLLLFGMYSEQHLGIFAQEDYDLVRFLTLADEELKKLGFELPFERKKIMHGLLKFHRQAWNKRSIKKFPKDQKLDSYDIFEAVSNHLKQATVMQASLMYVSQLLLPLELKDQFGPKLNGCLQKVTQLKQTITALEDEMIRIHALTTPKVVLHIDENSCPERKGRWLSRAIKFSILSGVIIVIVYRRMKN